MYIFKANEKLTQNENYETQNTDSDKQILRQNDSTEIYITRGPKATSLTRETSFNQWAHLRRAMIKS